MVNRTQALVLGFFLMALASLLVILLAAPEVYDQALRLPGTGRATEIAFLAALTAFITLLAVGVVRRWRWAFWLILVAFLAGVLRVPVAILQLTGALPADAPIWYVAFQGLIGLAQLAIGLAMLGSLLTEQRPCHAGGAATRETQGPWPCPALSVLRAKRLLLATALGGARQVSGRPPALRLGQAALGFTRSE